jgi:hypothetical protein
MSERNYTKLERSLLRALLAILILYAVSLSLDVTEKAMHMSKKLIRNEAYRRLPPFIE